MPETETIKRKWGSITLTDNQTILASTDESEVEPGLEEDYDPEEPEELGGPDGEVQPLD